MFNISKSMRTNKVDPGLSANAASAHLLYPGFQMCVENEPPAEPTGVQNNEFQYKAYMNLCNAGAREHFYDLENTVMRPQYVESAVKSPVVMDTVTPTTATDSGLYGSNKYLPNMPENTNRNGLEVVRRSAQPEDAFGGVSANDAFISSFMMNNSHVPHVVHDAQK